MKDYKLVDPGPFFSEEQLLPYLTQYKKSTRLVSMVRGYNGLVVIRKHGICVIVNDKRLLRCDFSRGTPLVLLEKDNIYYLVTQAAYEARKPKMITLVGS